MRKRILIVLTLSCFLLLVTPCINSIQAHEMKDMIENTIREGVKSFHLNIKNTVLISNFAKYLFVILYLIGYISMIPFMIFFTGQFVEEFTLKDWIDIFVGGFFLWPLVLLGLIEMLIDSWIPGNSINVR